MASPGVKSTVVHATVPVPPWFMHIHTSGRHWDYIKERIHDAIAAVLFSELPKSWESHAVINVMLVERSAFPTVDIRTFVFSGGLFGENPKVEAKEAELSEALQTRLFDDLDMYFGNRIVLGWIKDLKVSITVLEPNISA